MNVTVVTFKRSSAIIFHVSEMYDEWKRTRK